MACSVKICKNLRRFPLPGVSFHRFPKEEAMLTKWLKVLCINDKEWTWTKNKFVCSDHFTSDDSIYGKKITLKCRAVPSLKLIEQPISPIPSTSFSQSISVKSPETSMCNQDQNDVIELEDDNEEIQPMGVEFFKVCRSCLKIINIADAVSLDPQKNSKSLELMNKLKDLLQMDLMSVDDPHLCKDCVRVVETTYQFKVTCKKNECALTEFDWEARTKNLLFFVDQQELKYKCNEERMKQMNEGNPHLYINDSIEIDWDKFWEKLDKEGNGLSDMEDHWYEEEPREKVHTDHDYYCVDPPIPSNSKKLPQTDDLFSTAFDRYFKAHGLAPASQRLKKKCRKYHFKDIGPGPYVCEICGKVKKHGIQTHLKEHTSFGGFECRECGDVLAEYSQFVGHCKLKHGGLPKAVKCPQCPKRFSTKGRMLLHLRLHDQQSSEVKFQRVFVCDICDNKYTRKDKLKKHKEEKHKGHTVGLVCRDSDQVPERFNETMIVDYDEAICDERNTVGIGGDLSETLESKCKTVTLNQIDNSGKAYKIVIEEF